MEGSQSPAVFLTSSVLYFPPPYLEGHRISNIISLRNADKSRSITYKIKTTAPTRYTVRPRNGVVLSGGSQDIVITLHLPSDNPSSIRDAQDKFLIEYRFLRDMEPVDAPHLLWQSKPVEGVSQKKLSAKFEEAPLHFVAEEENGNLVLICSGEEAEVEMGQRRPGTEAVLPELLSHCVSDGGVHSSRRDMELSGLRQRNADLEQELREKVVRISNIERKFLEEQQQRHRAEEQVKFLSVENPSSWTLEQIEEAEKRLEKNLALLSEAKKYAETKKLRDLEKQMQELEDSWMCKVCFGERVSVIILPCNHLCMCEECAMRVDKCPICRKVVTQSIKVYTT